MYSHPAVLEAAVIGIPDPLPARGEQIIAFVCLRDGTSADEEELRQHSFECLADYKVPGNTEIPNFSPNNSDAQVSVAPEPSTVSLCGMAAGCGLALLRRRNAARK
jgi:long-chain acyl-CoA synthetase